MFGRPFPLFRLFGFSVKADPSWVVVVVLTVWSLARQFFPGWYRGLDPATYWVMGAAGAVGLFGSIVLHELAHSLVARRFGMPIRGITLFIFGGVAEMTDEPPTPKAEFWVALAGPAMSALIALAAFGGWWVGMHAEWPKAANGLLFFLWTTNLSLVAFNMIPAFPLDGGRILRSLLWGVRGNLRRATRITSAIGSLFGLLLIGTGIFAALYHGAIWFGVWNVLIGMFLRAAASSSYQQLLVRRALEGEPVGRFMTPDPVTAPGDVTLREFVEDYVYRHHLKMFPVADADGRLAGCVSIEKVKQVPQEEWPTTLVRQVAETATPRNTVSPDTDAMEALSRMQRLGVSRLMVADAGRLVGIFSLKDVMKLMALRVELDDRAPDEPRPEAVGREFETAR